MLTRADQIQNNEPFHYLEKALCHLHCTKNATMPELIQLVCYSKQILPDVITNELEQCLALPRMLSREVGGSRCATPFTER